MLLGDFCYNPDFILDVVNETTTDASVHNLLNYYIHCVGENPVDDYLDDIQAEVDTVIDEIGDTTSDWEGVGGTCTEEMNGLVEILEDVNDSIFSLLQTFDCVPINNAWYVYSFIELVYTFCKIQSIAYFTVDF